MCPQFKEWIFKDHKIKEAYDRGEDIYAYIASVFFNKDIKECQDDESNPDSRRRYYIAKNIVDAFWLHDINCISETYWKRWDDNYTESFLFGGK